MPNKPDVRLRRVYDEPSRRDGSRVLVDRVWPRGLSKDRARIDEWCKQVAPSTELRRSTRTTRTASPSSRAATWASSRIPSGRKR